VPIRARGRVVGCLDVSVTRAEDADPAYMPLTQACVSSIESTLDTLSALQARASSLERFASMGSLLATTLHDVRNPLNVLRGISHIGATTTKDVNEKAYFQRITKHSDTLLEMLNRVQDFARPQRPSAASPLEVVLEVLEDLAALCTAQACASRLRRRITPRACCSGRSSSEPSRTW
jgi:signal transduction histidine kinase